MSRYSERYEEKLAEVDYLSSQLPVVVCPYCQKIVGKDEMVKINGSWRCSNCR